MHLRSPTRVSWQLLSLVIVSSIHHALADEVSFVDLVHRMTDLQRLATLPAEGEKAAMWSSYDRAATFHKETGKYENWHANGDGNGLIRREGSSQVIAEMDGPGVIWRIWSANPEAGHMKVLLDGEPAIDMPFAHYFDAGHAPFDYDTLGYEAARGKNLYFPIPYQESCKIVAEEGWGRYYQITYTTYPKDTQLPRLAEAMTPESIAALRRANNYFADEMGTDPNGPRDGEKVVRRSITLSASSTHTVLDIDGPRAITALRAVAPLADRQQQMDAMRELVLQITWDGQTQPAVWCPLGDFFASTPGMNLYRALPAGMTENGSYSLWYMPFGSHAKVEILNEGKQTRKLQLEITHAPLDQPLEKLGRFHAKWHRDVMPMPKDRWPDWMVLTTQGRGRFCGMMLHVWNPRGGQCKEVEWCNGHWWWGEGDEKFFVDGEKFPSTFGTGTEDYFGYAWGSGNLFHHPYHNQTMTENNAGHQSINRFQIVDNVPFQNSFEGTLEKYFPNSQPTLYAAVAYWYLSADGVDPHGTAPVESRLGYYDRPPIIAGGYQTIHPVPGRVSTQPMANRKPGHWHNDDQLWWTDARPGDRLNLEIPVEKSGTYDIQAVLTKANDYAIVQFYLDGDKLGDPIDLYHPEVTRTEPISLGRQSLTPGKHTLSIEITGANEKAKKSYMCGLDQVLLESVP